MNEKLPAYLHYMQGWMCAAGLKEIGNKEHDADWLEGYAEGLVARTRARKKAQKKYNVVERTLKVQKR